MSLNGLPMWCNAGIEGQFVTGPGWTVLATAELPERGSSGPVVIARGSASSPWGGTCARTSPRRATRFFPIRCATWRSRGRAMSGRPTSPTSRSGGASSIWWRSSTGPAGSSWRGGCRPQWTSRSASPRWRRRWLGSASRRSSMPIGPANSPAATSPACWRRPAGASRWMDGRGGWIDSLFIERVWRRLKYQDIYLEGHAEGREARAGIRRMAGLLQSPAAAPGALQPDADGGVTRRDRRRARGRGSGYDAALGTTLPRCPHTTAAATASSRGLTVSGGRRAALPIKTPSPCSRCRGQL